jgi:hypothetical protein
MQEQAASMSKPWPILVAKLVSSSSVGNGGELSVCAVGLMLPVASGFLVEGDGQFIHPASSTGDLTTWLYQVSACI